MPVEDLVVLWMLGIGKDVEEAFVAREASDILGRASALDVGEAGVEVPGVRFDLVLNRNAVLPAVAEV
jgi:hypothetical protein